MNAQKIIQYLERMHGVTECELNYNSPFELLVAVILSARCTDKRVNVITPALFAVSNTPFAMAEMSVESLSSYIRSCGFYRNKAANIIGASRVLIDKFGGEVPSNVAELMTLPGVGRKTANVIFAVAFGGQAVAVDTHVFRLSHRLGLSEAKTPEGVENDLMKLFPKDSWTHLHHLLIHHGRYICKAQRPHCGECLLINDCHFFREVH